jgi:uncharacterized protein YaeQ
LQGGANPWGRALASSYEHIPGQSRDRRISGLFGALATPRVRSALGSGKQLTHQIHVKSPAVALSATVYHLQIELSDVDRGVYESLDLRLGRHPSETMRYLLTRIIAYCLCYEEGIAFSKGLSNTDEPAVWVKDLQGTLRTWIEVGTPSAERLHKASKASPRLVIFTHNDPDLLQAAARERAIHRVESIEVYALDGAFLDALAAVTDRNAKWALVHTEGTLYITSGEESLSTTVVRHPLGG